MQSPNPGSIDNLGAMSAHRDASHRTRAEGRAGGRLRFCVLTTFYPPHDFGGDGIGIQRLAHARARRGHRVTAVHDSDDT